MKYNVVDIKTGKITYYDTDNDNIVYQIGISDKDKLDSIDDKVIESYIREKKLKRIKNNK